MAKLEIKNQIEGSNYLQIKWAAMGTRIPLSYETLNESRVTSFPLTPNYFWFLSYMALNLNIFLVIQRFNR